MLSGVTSGLVAQVNVANDCTECLKCFQTKYALDKHMQNIHPGHEAYKCNMIVFMYCLCCIYPLYWQTWQF